MLAGGSFVRSYDDADVDVVWSHEQTKTRNDHVR